MESSPQCRWRTWPYALKGSLHGEPTTGLKNLSGNLRSLISTLGARTALSGRKIFHIRIKRAQDLRMGMRPVLQVALDLMHLKRALEIATEAVSGGADWLEAAHRSSSPRAPTS